MPPSFFDKESAFAILDRATRAATAELELRAKEIEKRAKGLSDEQRTASIREASRENVKFVLYDALGALKRGNTLSAQRSIEEAIDWLDQF